MSGLMHSSQPQSLHAHSGAQVEAGAMVAEVAGKADKSQSRFSSLPEVGGRASLQASMATLARCRGDFGGRSPNRHA